MGHSQSTASLQSIPHIDEEDDEGSDEQDGGADDDDDDALEFPDD
jgi:hypothetical protein